MTEDDLLTLAIAGESETVEFKESFNDEALETIGAFYNTRGGTLLIGVKDTGQISGIKIGKKTLEDISNRIQEATDPRLQPSLSVILYEGANVISVSVSSGNGAPVSIRGRYFRRVGRTKQRMSHEEIMQRMVANTGLSWDALTEPTASIHDLNLDLVSRIVQTVKKIGRRPVPEQISDQEFLRKMDLIREGIPTRAAILLFGKNPDSFFSSAFLKMGRFRSPIDIVDDREVHGSLFEQLDQAMSWFKERLETEFVFEGKLERTIRWEYPLNAVREALINALCHRDYTNHAHTQIRLYDHHLEIRNAGSLPAGLTPEMLLREHDSIPRNKKIADTFFYTGLIERWGSGTLRMASELERAGLPSPEFRSGGNGFQLHFYRELYREDQLKEMGLSVRQIQAVLYAKEHGSISNIEFQKLIDISKRTASRELTELTIKGIFISEGGLRGRGKIYKLRTAGIGRP